MSLERCGMIGLGLNKWLVLGGLAAALASTSAAYIKGRVDGWVSKETEHKAAISELAVQHAEELQAQALANAEQGAEVREVVRYIERDTEDIRDELAETDDPVCLVGDDTQRLLDRALAGPDGLYDRAARQRTDDAG